MPRQLLYDTKEYLDFDMKQVSRKQSDYHRQRYKLRWRHVEAIPIRYNRKFRFCLILISQAIDVSRIPSEGVCLRILFILVPIMQ